MQKTLGNAVAKLDPNLCPRCKDWHGVNEFGVLCAQCHDIEKSKAKAQMEDGQRYIKEANDEQYLIPF